MMSPALLDHCASTLATVSTHGDDFAQSFWDSLQRVLLLRDHNTRVPILGASLLGIAAGIIGSFMVLRRRALVGDLLSHATLPGVCAAFLVATMFGLDGRSLAILLPGAAATGMIGVAAVMGIRRWTRIKEDAALAIVLSVSFGLGLALLGIIQKLPTGNQAGLDHFIYGKTASMLVGDAMLIAIVGALVIAICLVLLRDFELLSFDRAFAASIGRPIRALDAVMMLLVTAVTVIGLQAVGLILMVAMLIIPPTAARFWCDQLHAMLLISAIIGALSGALGAGLSAVLRDLPAGGIIVCVAAALFCISLTFGPRRGLATRLLTWRRLSRRIQDQHLLRGLVEQSASTTVDHSAELAGVRLADLLPMRSWNMAALRRAVSRAARVGHVCWVDPSRTSVRLTPSGLAQGMRIERNNRLWEQYLIHYAHIAPSHVDHDADQIEHVLDAKMIGELERLVGSTLDRPAARSSASSPA